MVCFGHAERPAVRARAVERGWIPEQLEHAQARGVRERPQSLVQLHDDDSAWGVRNREGRVRADTLGRSEAFRNVAAAQPPERAFGPLVIEQASAIPEAKRLITTFRRLLKAG